MKHNPALRAAAHTVITEAMRMFCNAERRHYYLMIAL
jgi:hypothetical protein